MQKLFWSLIIINGVLSPSFGAETDASLDSFVVPKVDYSLGRLINKRLSPSLKIPMPTGSIDNDGLGGGLNINYASMFVDKETSDVINCGGVKLELPSPQAVALATASISASCAKITDADEVIYSEDNCRLLNSCAQAKTGRDLVTFANYSVGANMAAEDLATLLLSDRLPTMEKLESLRKYSDKKFGEGFSKECRPQFDAQVLKSDSCYHQAVETGFVNMVDSCTVPEKSCYNLGADFGKNTPENESALINFFNQKTDNKVTDSLAADNEILESLSQIMASKDSTDSKVKAAFAKMVQLRDEHKLDPAFDFESDNYDPASFSSTTHYKFFRTLAAKKLTTAGVKAEIEKHRRNYAKDVLNKDCKQSYNFADICEKVTDASYGKTEAYPNRISAASRFKKLDSKHIEFLKLVFGRSVKNDTDARVVLNASRCVALGIIPSTSIADFNDVNMSISGIQPDGIGLRFGSDFWNTPGSPIGSTVLNQGKEELFESPNLTYSETIRPLKMTNSLAESTSVVNEVIERPISETFSENLKNIDTAANNTSFSTNNFATTNAFNNFPNTSFHTEAPVEQAVEKKSSNTAPVSNPLNDRIAELTKKLSATEDHLSKLQENKDADLSEKAAQKKRDDDNKQISDLQNQIAELKKEAAKAPEKSVAIATDTSMTSVSRAPALSGSAPVVESTKKDEQEKNVAASESASSRSAGQSAQSSSSVSGGESAAISKSTSSSSGSSSGSSISGGKPLLVLSKSDGMTAEKITESISEKIIELGGQSFEIEENGVKMEIIPEIRDGKILLDAKGKPRFLKKVKSGKELVASKTRVPASVTNKADLLRIDEEALKRERAEYLKLKNLTNKAVQKKD